MKVSSRVTRSWSQERFQQSSELGLLCTVSSEHKTEQLVQHIEAFLVKLGEVSSMEQDLVQLLEVLLSIIKKKRTEVI